MSWVIKRTFSLKTHVKTNNIFTNLCSNILWRRRQRFVNHNFFIRERERGERDKDGDGGRKSERLTKREREKEIDRPRGREKE